MSARCLRALAGPSRESALPARRARWERRSPWLGGRWRRPLGVRTRAPRGLRSDSPRGTAAEERSLGGRGPPAGLATIVTPRSGGCGAGSFSFTPPRPEKVTPPQTPRGPPAQPCPAHGARPRTRPSVGRHGHRTRTEPWLQRAGRRPARVRSSSHVTGGWGSVRLR